MWVFGIATVITVVLALGLMAVVAISSGQLDAPWARKWQRLARNAARHLNGEGNPPRALARLDLRED